MVALKRVNGAGSVGALVRVSGGIEKGQRGHWSGRVNGGVSVNGGIEKGQSALVRVNGGVRVNGSIEKGGRWSGSMGVLNNGGSMGALNKNNEEGIGQRRGGY